MEQDIRYMKDPYVITRNRKLAEKIIKGLNSRNMLGYYAETRDEALKIALDMIPEGSSVSWGGALSMWQVGLKQALLEGNYEVYNRDQAGSNRKECRKYELAAMDCDYYICSTNAISEDGVLVNIDGIGNRVAAISFGPRNVLMIVGMNKVAKDVDTAVSRARNVAAPTNAQRFDIDTPCKVTGACANCKSDHCICSHMLITRFSMLKNRIKVILVNDDLGF